MPAGHNPPASDITQRLTRSNRSVCEANGGGSRSAGNSYLPPIRTRRPPYKPAFPYPEAARLLEIFLDYLSFHTRTTTHLLAGQPFDDVLSPGERQVRDALTAFWRTLSAEAGGKSGPGQVSTEVKQTAAWPEIERLLLRLGFQAGE